MSKSAEEEKPTQEAVCLDSERRNAGGLVDMCFQLRMRSFFALCIPPLFERLEADFAVDEMRRRGVTQVMYYLDFKHYGVPLAVAHPLRVRHKLKMHRSISGADGRPTDAGTERLLWHSVNHINGYRKASANCSLGAAADGGEASAEIGVGRAIHILTRPTAAAGERAVTEVPEPLHLLRLHGWSLPLPTAQALTQPPSGSKPLRAHFRHEYRDLWGVVHTDHNQHVNVLEYVMGLESQLARHCAVAGLDIDQMIRRLQMLFRRPCFAGEHYLLATELYISGESSYFLGSYFPLDSHGRPSARAAVLAMAEGVPVASL